MIRVLTYDGHMTGAADKAAADADATGRLPPTNPKCWIAASTPA